MVNCLSVDGHLNPLFSVIQMHLRNRQDKAIYVQLLLQKYIAPPLCCLYINIVNWEGTSPGN